jgi:hypothetical protein
MEHSRSRSQSLESADAFHLASLSMNFQWAMHREAQILTTSPPQAIYNSFADFAARAGVPIPKYAYVKEEPEALFDTLIRFLETSHPSLVDVAQFGKWATALVLGKAAPGLWRDPQTPLIETEIRESAQNCGIAQHVIASWLTQVRTEDDQAQLMRTLQDIIQRITS